MNRIHFIRAYWSDIILVESNGRFALIDTGYARDFERICIYLDEVGVKELNFILITHFHKDHYGSLPALLKRYPVGKVYMKKFSGINRTDGSGRPATEESNRLEMENCEGMCRLAEEVSRLVVIDEHVTSVSVGDFDFRLFGVTDAVREMYESPDSPYRGQVIFGENTNSVAMFCDVQGTTIYLGADANDQPLDYPKYNRVNDQFARQIGRAIDLYKVPHHCCGTIFSEEILNIFKPKYSIITNWWMTVERRFTANLDMLRKASPDGTILYTDCCGYAFTIRENGSLSCEEITPIPKIILEEIPVEEMDAFWEKHIRYLVEDGIITDPEDIDYFSGDEYRSVILEHMRREKDKHHLVYFVCEGKRIGAASYCIYQEDGQCFILDFWIFRQFRGMGTGHYCYYALEEAARAAGAKYFQMNIHTPLAFRFWKAFGYKEAGADEWGDPLYEMRPDDYGLREK
ncbi:MAG: GNAT family N-acetyltransferase [Firmicutes bacterium]|nr:GNAT family N-acetyltransferase [Bacillota bacterium]